jgi:hypothetical protein
VVVLEPDTQRHLEMENLVVLVLVLEELAELQVVLVTHRQYRQAKEILEAVPQHLGVRAVGAEPVQQVQMGSLEQLVMAEQEGLEPHHLLQALQ